MEKQPTSLLSKMTALFKILERHGIDVNEFLASEGIDPSHLQFPDSRISLAQMHSLTHKAVALVGDEHLGLHQGEVYPGLPNILCYVMMNCYDLGAAIEKYDTYQRIMDETRRTEIISEGDAIAICMTITNDDFDMDIQLSDAMLCCLFMFFKFLTGQDIALKEVRFRHAAPENISEYTRIFQCPVVFNSHTNAIVMDKQVLNTRLLHPNHKLRALFEKQAAEVLQRINSSDSYAGRVSRMIIQSLQGSHPRTIETIARELATSVRNLQLKLKEEGTTYRELLNTTRKDLAIEYLKDSTVSVGEIAYLLGFSEPSAFHRFFRKCTGHTPIMYRENLIPFEN